MALLGLVDDIRKKKRVDFDKTQDEKEEVKTVIPVL